MEYNKMLIKQFKDLKINLVKHDTSFTGLPAYIEVQLGKSVAVNNRGPLVLDLGNYLYRLGFKYQMTPEYRGKGKTTSLRWFLSWDDVSPLVPHICKTFKKKVLGDKHLPIEFKSLIIQDASRGVLPDTSNF